MENDEQGSLVELTRFRIKAAAVKKEVSKGDSNKAKKEASKPPPAKKVVEPPSAEVLAQHSKILAVGEECIEESEMLALLQAKPNAFRLYDGFEPSGRMHIAQGVFKSINVNTCTSIGGEFVFWVADFFALMNDKMGGDLEKIKVVGEYLVEVWKAAGMNMDRVRFVWASDEIIQRSEVYCRIVADIARRFSVNRLVKCCQIMGRQEGNLTAAQILYPLMQCADIFFLEADVCQLGMDQRKVNALAREYAQLAGKRFKPVILSHHMLFGLKAGQEKMSKSDSDSAIFMEDSKEDVERKIMQAHCPREVPADEVDDDSSLLTNPCLDYIKHICFHGQPDMEFAGYKNYRDVRAAFISGQLSEDNLKQTLASKLNDKVEPVRIHFSEGRPKELLESVKLFKQQALAKQVPQKTQELDGPEDEDAMGGGRRKKGSSLAPIRKCSIKALNGKPASHVVFLNHPKAFRGIPLSEVLGVIVRLLRGIALQSETEKAQGEKVVLLVPDLGFICRNCLADQDSAAAAKRKIDDKGPFASVGRKSSPTLEIDAYIDAALCIIKEFVNPESFVVVKESEMMNEDPLNYLLSVINVGRAFKLDEVLPAVGLPPTCSESDSEGGKVGLAIEGLFQVADILALGPPRCVLFEPNHEKLLKLAQDFFDTDLAKQFDCGQPPLIIRVEMPNLRMAKTKGDNDVETIVYVSDEDKEVNKKVSRCYCKPGDMDFNPVLGGICALLEVPELKPILGLGGAPLMHIKRPEEHGGDLVFDSVSQIASAFSKGTEEGEFPPDALHPGDLKPASTVFLKRLVERARKAIPAPASKLLEAARKRNPERNVEL